MISATHLLQSLDLLLVVLDGLFVLCIHLAQHAVIVIQFLCKECTQALLA